MMIIGAQDILETKQKQLYGYIMKIIIDIRIQILSHRVKKIKLTPHSKRLKKD